MVDPFSNLKNGIFNIIKNEMLDNFIMSMKNHKDIPPPLRYCSQHITIRFLDTLTYPRPVRKFTILLSHTTKIHFIRSMLLAEVGLKSIDDLVLMTKGRAIGRDKDDESLRQFGMLENQQIVISRTLGTEGNSVTKKSSSLNGMAMDMFFTPHTDGRNVRGMGVVEAFARNHGYQLLGRCLERLVLQRFSQAFAKEEGARRSEEELYALLEMENAEKNAEDEKRRKKKEKKKNEKAKTNPIHVDIAPSTAKKNGITNAREDEKKSEDGDDDDDDDDDNLPAPKSTASAVKPALKSPNQPTSSSTISATHIPSKAVSSNGNINGKDKSMDVGLSKTTIVKEEEQLRNAMALSLKEYGIGAAPLVSSINDADAEEIQVSSKKQKKKQQEAAKKEQAQQQMLNRAVAPSSAPTKTSIVRNPVPPAPSSAQKGVNVSPVPPTSAVSRPATQARPIAALKRPTVPSTQKPQSSVTLGQWSDPSQRALPVAGLDTMSSLMSSDMASSLLSAAPSGRSNMVHSAGPPPITQSLTGFSLMGMASQQGPPLIPASPSLLSGLTGSGTVSSLPPAGILSGSMGATLSTAAAPRYCPSCGSRVHTSGRFCSNCGASLELASLDALGGPTAGFSGAPSAGMGSFGTWENQASPQVSQSSGILGGLGLGGMDTISAPSPLSAILNNSGLSSGLSTWSGSSIGPPSPQADRLQEDFFAGSLMDFLGKERSISTSSSGLGSGMVFSGLDQSAGSIPGGPIMRGDLGLGPAAVAMTSQNGNQSPPISEFANDYGFGLQSELMPTAQPFIPGTTNSARQVLGAWGSAPIKTSDKSKQRDPKKEPHSNNSPMFSGWR